MAEHESYGTCSFCQERVARSRVSQHLRSCKERKRAEEELRSKQPGRSEVDVYHLAVEPKWGADFYWLHVAVRGDASLDSLDQFLRVIWLECCGHMSNFEIRGRYFTSGGFGGWQEGPGMDVKAGRVLEPRLRFEYTYDMGDSTDLKLRVVGVSKRPAAIESVTLLARNEDPGICCSYCDNLARWVCTECLCSGEGWLCEKCGEEHNCGDEMQLPVVNSPRVGVCGYCGPE